MVEQRSPTDEVILKFVMEGYLHEARTLAEIARSGNLSRLLPRFLDYKHFINTERAMHYSDRFVESLLSRHAIINTEHPSKELSELYTCANLAAACTIFDGWQLPLTSLTPEYLPDQVARAVNSFHQGDIIKAIQLSDKLNGADTVRVIQTLKQLGLIRADTSTCRQLSLGAARGMRDVYSAHLYPRIESGFENTILAREPGAQTIKFSAIQAYVHDVVLVDSHPMYKAHYQAINEKSEAIRTLHKDTYEALEDLSEQCANWKIQPRDLVLAFRIDHRMLPDVDRFLAGLGQVISDKADLILTIGAGHTLEDFQGRLDKIGEISAHLENRGMQPVRLQWCRGNSPREMREHPVFGTISITSFEILYCRLERALLAPE